MQVIKLEEDDHILFQTLVFWMGWSEKLCAILKRVVYNLKGKHSTLNFHNVKILTDSMNKKYTIDICRQMWASAGMVMMNTKD